MFGLTGEAEVTHFFFAFILSAGEKITTNRSPDGRGTHQCSYSLLFSYNTPVMLL